MQSLPRLLLDRLSSALPLAAPVAGQRADDQILPKSVELQRQAQRRSPPASSTQAEDLLETALAVDPRNRGAFVDIARVAEKQHLFGKAIRMTNKALLLEPNDPDAIAVQGEAMVEHGRDRARAGEPAEASDDLRRQGLSAGGAAVGRDQPRSDGRRGQGSRRRPKSN